MAGTSDILGKLGMGLENIEVDEPMIEVGNDSDVPDPKLTLSHQPKMATKPSKDIGKTLEEILAFKNTQTPDITD